MRYYPSMFRLAFQEGCDVWSPGKPLVQKFETGSSSRRQTRQDRPYLRYVRLGKRGDAFLLLQQCCGCGYEAMCGDVWIFWRWNATWYPLQTTRRRSVSNRSRSGHSVQGSRRITQFPSALGTNTEIVEDRSSDFMWSLLDWHIKFNIWSCSTLSLEGDPSWTSRVVLHINISPGTCFKLYW